MDWGPSSIFGNEAIGEDDDFSSDGGEGEFGWFSSCCEVLVAALHVGIAAACDQGGHIERAAQGRSSTLDAAFCLDGATFARMRREAGEGGDLLAGDTTDLGELGQEGQGGDRPHAGYGAQDGGLAIEFGVGLYDGVDMRVEPFEVTVDSTQPCGKFAPQEGRGGGAETVGDGDALGDGGLARAREFLERLLFL